MTVNDLVSHIKGISKIAYEYTDPVIINWINELEQSLWTNELTDLASANIVTSLGTAEYDLPTNVNFEDIAKVYEKVDNKRQFQYSLCNLDYFINHGYYKTNNKIGINPAPTAAGNIEVVYRLKPTIKTATDNTSLPDAFRDVYVNYVLFNIHLLQQEIDISNNFLLQYNSRINAIKEWWYKTK